MESLNLCRLETSLKILPQELLKKITNYIVIFILLFSVQFSVVCLDIKKRGFNDFSVEQYIVKTCKYSWKQSFWLYIGLTKNQSYFLKQCRAIFTFCRFIKRKQKLPRPLMVWYSIGLYLLKHTVYWWRNKRIYQYTSYWKETIYQAKTSYAVNPEFVMTATPGNEINIYSLLILVWRLFNCLIW